jgi:uncharacterized protein
MVSVRRRSFIAIAIFCLGFAGVAFAQDVDPELMTYINSVKAVDNHAHVFAPDVADDKGYDALRCDPLPVTPGLFPAPFRFGADTQTTWKALYGVAPATAEEADQKRAQMLGKVRAAHGADYYDWILDQAGVETVLANRVAMTPGLKASRFRWVPFGDALLFPFDNKELENTPDRHELFKLEDELRGKYFAQAEVKAAPESLDEYVEKVVDGTLRRLKDGGGVALKFEAAYLRGLDFGRATREEAEAVYRRGAGGTALKPTEYKILEDYLFHVVAVKAGEIGLVIHIHTGAGCGEYFDIAGSDPMLLDRAFNDESLRGTKFVMLHGGSPFERHASAMILKPNVYVDFSVLGLEFSPSELARILRPWLESMPEHVLYGTDAGFFSPGMGWQETTWLGTKKSRTALGIVLTAMVRERVISEARAKEIAAGVLRENAWKLYGFGKASK